MFRVKHHSVVIRRQLANLYKHWFSYSERKDSWLGDKKRKAGVVTNNHLPSVYVLLPKSEIAMILTFVCEVNTVGALRPPLPDPFWLVLRTDFLVNSFIQQLLIEHLSCVSSRNSHTEMRKTQKCLISDFFTLRWRESIKSTHEINMSMLMSVREKNKAILG